MGEDDLDPKGYRGLALLSVCYRIWGVATLRRSAPWVQSWQTGDLYAGTTAPLGAEDAWYIVNLQVEDAKLQGKDISGGALIYTTVSIRSSSGCSVVCLKWLASPLIPSTLMPTSTPPASSTTQLVGDSGSHTSTHAASPKDAR